MTSLCIISTELPPTKTFATTADEANENIIQVFKKLNFKLFYIFIDEDRHYYKDSNPEKAIRIKNIKSDAALYIIEKSSISTIKNEIDKIIEINKLENFYIFQNCIDFIEKKKRQKNSNVGIA